ncbi:Tti2p Ecym_5154 [Eremothecium cymbalariae DBVPG|uniref:Uncharacterized protein n=1 Tax=Eremothecium cymbalariae (strain CBS 270.75 / DBVPG 7215 / KCTC 17166 / NRRL Y-17582) TaxID=931890 RepID=I6NCY8_ERECY|nr:hypothetical protein Ecym_5154 [Eremothecium cymbalariae DBVPG\
MHSNYENSRIFLNRVDSSMNYLPRDDELIEICGIIDANENDIKSLRYNLILRICYYTMDDRLSPSTAIRCRDTIKNLMSEELLEFLIKSLNPILLKLKNNKASKSGRKKIEDNSFILRPRLGFSAKEDDLRTAWKNEGGLRSIPLFHIVLTYLKHDQISSNLWWITPGILNFLDDDQQEVKLSGVKLLRQFLEVSIDYSNTLQFSFSGTRLFDIYHPILLNLCYHMPPLTDVKTVTIIWRDVFPTLIALYKVEYIDDVQQLKVQIGSLLSEVIVQLIIPKIASEYPELTIIALDYATQLIHLLETSTVRYLQRIIYMLGEYIVRNPFITLFMPLVIKSAVLLQDLVLLCPTERVVAHKYDFLACVLILYDKCEREGTLSPEILEPLSKLMNMLKEKGCDYTDDREKILKRNQKFDVIIQQI